MNKILRTLENELRERFQSDRSGYDLYHLKRVMNTALHIQSTEGGDRTIIAVSALLHDVHRIIQHETGTFCSPKDSLPAVKEILDKTSLPEETKEAVLHCVEYHEEYIFSRKGKTASDLETLILQDADNLDAMGAVGIGRTFSFGGSYGVPMWVPGQPFGRKYYGESEKDPSVLHHFHSKLLRLKDNMHTETAKKLAEERHQFMEQFVDQFMAEWSGRY